VHLRYVTFTIPIYLRVHILLTPPVAGLHLRLDYRWNGRWIPTVIQLPYVGSFTRFTEPVVFTPHAPTRALYGSYVDLLPLQPDVMPWTIVQVLLPTTDYAIHGPRSTLRCYDRSLATALQPTGTALPTYVSLYRFTTQLVVPVTF